MRDLYKEIGLSRNATIDDITFALQKIADNERRRKVEFILLNQNRKSMYDNTHHTLTTIGKLRDNLNLKHVGFWAGAPLQDFLYSNRKGLSQTEQLNHKLRKRTPILGADLEPTSVIFTLLVVGLVAYAWFGSNSVESPPNTSVSRPPTTTNPSSTVRPPNEVRTPVKSEPAFNEPVLTLPQTGILKNYSTLDRIAPLEVQTIGNNNYFVKLEAVSSGSKVLELFVRGGTTLNIDVPLGQYRMKYASGESWYGYEHLFGPSTNYTLADSTFSFVRQGNQVNGYTITLYPVTDGNLQTRTLSADQF